MAITKVDVQGIILTVDAGVVGCVQSLGNLEETRAITEYTCMTSQDSAKSGGAISRSALDISVLLDPSATTDGQKALRDAFASNTEVAMEIELNDGGTSGTTFAFTGLVSKLSITMEKDAAVGLDISVELASAITETALVA